MSTVISHGELLEREIETRIETGIQALIASGVKASDITERDIELVVRSTYQGLSPAGRMHSAKAGLLQMVEVAIGEQLAERIWAAGTGWPSTDDEVRDLAASINIDPAQAPVCLKSFRVAASVATRDDLEAFSFLSRFAPLFVDAADGARLSELSIRKAEEGDKLAMSFLAWRDMA